jgi:DDE family transposase
LDQDLFEEVQAQMRDPTFRHKMSERMRKCEGLFAEAKQNHGLARARYRGRRRVQIQAYLSATVKNLKRLVFLFYHWLAGWWSSLVFDRQLGCHLDEVARSDPRVGHRAARLFQHARWFLGTRKNPSR